MSISEIELESFLLCKLFLGFEFAVRSFDSLFPLVRNFKFNKDLVSKVF